MGGGMMSLALCPPGKGTGEGHPWHWPECLLCTVNTLSILSFQRNKVRFREQETNIRAHPQ